MAYLNVPRSNRNPSFPIATSHGSEAEEVLIFRSGRC
jgi:hypothetical protein